MMPVEYVRDSTLVADPKWSVSSGTSDACPVAEEMSEGGSEAGQGRDDQELPCQVNGFTATNDTSVLENFARQSLWYMLVRACSPGMGSRITPKELE